MALCCVAPKFERSAKFGFEKPASEPCRHLAENFRCVIHDNLSAEGFEGCVDYPCYGAGQKVTKQIYQGECNWMSHPELAERIFSTFFIVKALHKLLSYLNEAKEVRPDPAIRSKIIDKQLELEVITFAGEEAIDRADISDHKEQVQNLVTAVAAAVKISQ
jgi:hypothetical protein